MCPFHCCVHSRSNARLCHGVVRLEHLLGWVGIRPLWLWELKQLCRLQRSGLLLPHPHPRPLSLLCVPRSTLPPGSVCPRSRARLWCGVGGAESRTSHGLLVMVVSEAQLKKALAMAAAASPGSHPRPQGCLCIARGSFFSGHGWPRSCTKL